ncbi:MAG TPA: MFS transporter [Steroidobacteraceae bacterium]|nr:MFS transporter [Steroidobacteraceae bacterium]
MNTPTAAPPAPFSPYQKVVVGLLAFLQFAVIVDFMLISPLGAFIVPTLSIEPAQFGIVVAAYAWAAAASSLLTAGFADRFDRKRLLLFFYAGFILGTLWCGLARSFESLLAARIVTGIFGGVIGSIVLAIATDLFPPQMRGRVMGLVQSAFAASQVLGLPFGMYVSTHWNWHVPFLVLAGIGVLGGLLIAWQLKPVDEHLKVRQEKSPFAHLRHTLSEPRHLLAFLAMTFLATGGFMLMPFSSLFTVHNLGIDVEHLTTIFLVTGLVMIIAGPLLGKLADAIGRLPVFFMGTAVTIVMVLIYTHLGPTTLPVVIVVNVVLFIGIFSRMIPFQALMSQVPSQTQRGSFNAINSSIQLASGGLAAFVAGHIVHEAADHHIEHYDIAGYVVIVSSLLTALLLWRLNRALTAPVATPAAARQ